MSTPSAHIDDDTTSTHTMAASMTSIDSAATLEPDVRLAVEALEGLRAGETQPSPAFLERVSHYPLVRQAVTAYESGKTSNRGFRIGADVFESVAKPVVKRLEPLDNFACRQLDRIEGRKGGPGDEGDLEQGNLGKRKQRSDSFEAGERADTPMSSASNNNKRWQNVLTGASGLTISMSDESMRSLHYCVSWLQWAGSHLTGLLQTLQEHIAAREKHDAAHPAEASQQTQSGQYVMKIKREIVGTLKKVVDIVSTYAGGALPEPARCHVRSYVLGLPSRWARKQSLHCESEKRDIEEGNRVSSLARESIEMLHNITEIVSRTLRQAEDWCQWRGHHPPQSQMQEATPRSMHGFPIDEKSRQEYRPTAIETDNNRGLPLPLPTPNSTASWQQ